MSVTIRIRRAHRIAIVGLVVFGVLYTAGTTTAVSRAYAPLAQARLARAADPGAGRLLAGLTKQGTPVVVGVARNEKRLSVVAVLQMTCTSGNAFLTEEYWPALTVAPNGSVHGAAAIAPSPGSANSAAVTGGSHSIEGSLNRKHARFAGRMRLQLNFTLQNGQTDSCDSGNVPIGAIL